MEGKQRFKYLNCSFIFFRCNQNPDCDDISDEKGCKIVVIDPKNYLKDLADKILKAEDATKYKSSIERINFYESYDKLRKAYQKKSAFRCKIPHRFHSIFHLMIKTWPM